MKSIKDLTNPLKRAYRTFGTKHDISQFQNYIFLITFYRFLSDNLNKYMKVTYNKNYESMNDDEAEGYKNEIINKFDCYIPPTKLFNNLIKKRINDTLLDKALIDVFDTIRTSSSYNIRNVIQSLDVDTKKIGKNDEDRRKALATLLQSVQKINYDFDDDVYDIFGYIYEFMLNCDDVNYRNSISKGIFYTQDSLARLLKEISELYVPNPINVYDPTCGSGSLLTQYAKYNNTPHFYGNEILETPYGLCIMNMILHKVNNFNIENYDTLLTFKKEHKDKYDLILGNPPFSIEWEPNSIREDDEYFKNKPLPSPQYADYAFLYHIIYALNQNGVALVINGMNMLSREKKEETEAKKYLVENNYIDAIIHLPNNLFQRTSTDVCLFIIRKNKTDKNILFIDASDQSTTVNKTKYISDKNYKIIIDLIKKRETVDGLSYLATPEEIAEKDYNLLIAKYINYNRGKVFKIPTNTAPIKFIYKDEEEQNYIRRKKFVKDFNNANEYINKCIKKLIDEDKVTFETLDSVAIVEDGLKENEFGAICNDSYPYRYIVSDQIQNGTVLVDHDVANGTPSKRIKKEALDEFLRKRPTEPGDLLFTLTTNGPKVAVIFNKVDFAFFNYIRRIHIRENYRSRINPVYLRYLFESEYGVKLIDAYARKNKAVYIKLSELKKVVIPIIPIEQQEELCSIFAILESEYTKLMIEMEREMEVYKNGYTSAVKKAFKDIPQQTPED